MVKWGYRVCLVIALLLVLFGGYVIAIGRSPDESVGGAIPILLSVPFWIVGGTLFVIRAIWAS